MTNTGTEPQPTIGLESFDLAGWTRPSRLGLGGCPLGGHGWGAWQEQDLRDAVAAAVDRGVTLFDTADCYGFGRSEELLAAALGPRRHEVTVASKFGVRWKEGSRATWRDTSPTYLRQALEASLRRLRLECIPLYFIHWPDGTTPIADTMAELVRCREQGKIRWIGVSNFSRDELDQALAVAPVAALQVLASLIRRERLADLVPYASARGIPVLTWGSLGQGLLSGKHAPGTSFTNDDRRSRYDDFQGERFSRNLTIAAAVREAAGRCGRSPAQVALRWLLDTPGVSAVLVGAKTATQGGENIGALGWNLAGDEYAALAACAEGS